MKILIDNGHGKETAGKRSPVWKNGTQLLEYKYTREIAIEVVNRLRNSGIDAQLLTPQINDVPLAERVKRANLYAERYGRKNTLVVSIHTNASANGKGAGWEIHTSPGKTISDIYATVIWNEAKDTLQTKYKKRMRTDMTDGDPDIENDFYILRKTSCPAVLTENLFHDNEQDCAFLLSKEGREAIVQIHVEAIKKIEKLC